MHCLNGGDGLFAIYTVKNGTTETMAYVLKDHLGSIHCLVDEAGAKTEELSFDAWGRRRNPTNWQPLTQTYSYEYNNWGRLAKKIKIDRRTKFYNR